MKKWSNKLKEIYSDNQEITGVIFHEGSWQVWYKGVKFAEKGYFKDAYVRLEALIDLDDLSFKVVGSYED